MVVSKLRIDDRLIHGQVVTSWVAQTGAKRIVCIDDETAASPMMKKLNEKLAPQGTTVHVFNTEEAIPLMKEYYADEKNKYLVLVRLPKTIMDMVDAGVPVKEIIVGGMGKRGTRTKLFRNITADEEERAIFRKLDGMGIKTYMHIIPSDKPVDVMTLI